MLFKNKTITRHYPQSELSTARLMKVLRRLYKSGHISSGRVRNLSFVILRIMSTRVLMCLYAWIINSRLPSSPPLPPGIHYFAEQRSLLCKIYPRPACYYYSKQTVSGRTHFLTTTDCTSHLFLRGRTFYLLLWHLAQGILEHVFFQQQDLKGSGAKVRRDSQMNNLNLILQKLHKNCSVFWNWKFYFGKWEISTTMGAWQKRSNSSKICGFTQKREKRIFQIKNGEIKPKMTANVTYECGTEVKLDGSAEHKRNIRHKQRMKGEVPNESQPKLF